MELRALETKELSIETHQDWLEIMGPQGGAAGCFCTFFRQTSREFEENKGDENRRLARTWIEAGEMPGLIGYLDRKPVGWVQIGPRHRYSRLYRSPISRPLDNRDAWAVTCFVIAKSHRRQGVGLALLRAAVDYAKQNGATVLEGYPMEARSNETPPIWAWMGFDTMFERCGFHEVERRSPTRPFMRLDLTRSD
ncbi:MAG: GNAT family N-acetyltransferase [Acidimicrobiia bacterium]